MRPYAAVSLLFMCVLAVAGCVAARREPVGHSNPAREPVVLSAPDTSFHLTPAQRVRLEPSVDPDLVERFLQWLPPEHRTVEAEGFLRSAGHVGWHHMKLTFSHPELERIVADINASWGRRPGPGTPR